MSDLLNTLNAPSEAPPKTWEQEVAEAGAAEPAQSVPEPAAPAPAPVEPQAQEAAPEAPQAQETTADEPDRRVPLKALQEERQKRAEAERRAAETERRIAELAARMEQIAPKEPAPPPPPDPEIDPIGALKYQNERLQELRNREEQQRYEQELNAIAYRAATEFSAQAPDYRDAYQYAINSRATELSVLGVPSDQIANIMRREELTLIDNARRNGRNPAQVIYEFAKARGFQAPPPAPAPVAAAPAPAPVAPQPAAPNLALQQAKAAVAASASAGGAPAAKGEPNINDLLTAKGAVFDKMWDKHFGGNKSSLFRE